MSLRKEMIHSVREELVQRQAMLSAELTKSTEGLLNDDVSFADSVDQAAADTDKAITVQIKNRGRDTLVQINQAIRRLDEGTFGNCEQCDSEIADARIKAFPFTTLCIDCKAELESEQGRYPGRA